MKAAISPYQIQIYPKKRWNGLVIAVLGLVILSMLVPLAFLFGLHTGVLSAGLIADDETAVRTVLRVYTQRFSNYVSSQSKDLPNSVPTSLNKTGNASSKRHHQTIPGQPAQSYDNSTQGTNKNSNSPVETPSHRRVVADTDFCSEIKFGSYCLWRIEYKEVLKDTMVKKLKDLLFIARAYFPSIPRLPAYDKFAQELKHNILDFKHMLDDATSDADLPQSVDMKVRRMETAMSKARSMLVDCTNIDERLRQLIDAIEDQSIFHMRQGAFLYQLTTVQTMPKSLHCLSMRLTVEYFHSLQLELDVDVEGLEAQSQRYADPLLYHYVIFSKNILASSVVINSTLLHAKEKGKVVFHVLTDKQNYFAMKFWFSRSIFKNTTIQVLNIEEVHDDNQLSQLSVPEEFRVLFQNSMRTEYLSLFSRSHYLLPGILKDLDKIVILDDDIVVQKDLSALWSIDMERKVNGAVEVCTVKLSKISSYLGGNVLNQKSCAWMSGLNVVDLKRWRELDLTETFRSSVEELGRKGISEGAESRASLLVFQGLVYGLPGSWVLSGLGHEYGVSKEVIRTSPVLHYNGDLKPWLELGVPQYKTFWKKYLYLGDPHLSDCNVNP